MSNAFHNYLLHTTQASGCRELEVIQSLWSGYGKISRYQLVGSNYDTVVVKCISLSSDTQHPRGWNTDKSHSRKVKSYEVESQWYEQWSKECTASSKVPLYIGSFEEGGNRWIVLEDLDVNYPLRKDELSLREVKVCLTWLAHFHATFLGREPSGLWKVGTYWHLDTRPDELQKMQHKDLKAKANRLDDLLNTCRYQTVVHGDAKLANFCFSSVGESVAAVDFQYVGGGCGMKDVAYFLGSCLSDEECQTHEVELLDFYFAELKKSVDTSVDDLELEEEWRQLYPLAVADFVRFLLGWMPSHSKLNSYSLGIMEDVLKSF